MQQYNQTSFGFGNYHVISVYVYMLSVRMLYKLRIFYNYKLKKFITHRRGSGTSKRAAPENSVSLP